MNYEQVKGRGHVQQPAAAAAPQRMPPPLSEEEKAHAARMAALHRQHMPDCKEFVAELVKEGMIAGWRNFVSIEVIERAKS